MKRRIYILSTIILLIGSILGRSIDIPHFGLERIVFPETTDYGALKLGGGYAPLYIDPDSTRVTIYGSVEMGFLRWLSFNVWIPHYTEARGSLLKAGPGDAVCGLNASGEIPFIPGLHLGAFAQASVPSGYKGSHAAFPDFTSGANDFGFGGAIGFVQEESIHITGNLSASMPEDMTDVYYRAGGGLKIMFPWQIDMTATYLTDFSAKPPHDFHFNLSKEYKFMKLTAGVSKDFARHEVSFGYNFGLETRIQLYEYEPIYLPGVKFIDRTDWARFPTEDTLWNNLMNLQPKYLSYIKDEITVEYGLIDFTNELERKTLLPLVLRKENIQGRYTMSFKVKDTEGRIVADKNIYGFEDRQGEFFLLESDSDDYTKYVDYVEVQQIKKKALEELFLELHSETRRIRRGQY